MKLPHFILILALLLTSVIPAHGAASDVQENIPARQAISDSTATSTIDNTRRLRFTWGADLGAAVDMSGHDMSALGIGAMFGMEWRWIRFLGVGAEADVMVANSSRAFPLSVIFRTDFSKTRRLLFMDLRGGVAPSYFDHDRQETVPYISAGMGITLASGRTFSSHLSLSYSYLGQKECYNGDTLRKCPGISFIHLRLGVAF